MKRALFARAEKSKRTKASYLYVGSHWLINSLGILFNRDSGVSAPQLGISVKLPVSFEITGNNPKWQTDSYNLGEDIILKYYDPMPN